MVETVSPFQHANTRFCCCKPCLALPQAACTPKELKELLSEVGGGITARVAAPDQVGGVVVRGSGEIERPE